MPAPDPNAVWIEESDGYYRVSYEPYLWTCKVGNRKARAEAIMRRMIRGDWRCNWCLDGLPDWRRADVQFCGERCRKRAARARREWRG